MRWMRCNTEYILVCTQYKSVYTSTRSYIHVWKRTYWYKTVYTCMNAVYLSIYAYERVHTNTRPYKRVWMLYIWVQVRIYAYETFCKSVHGSSFEFTSTEEIQVRQIESWECSGTTPRHVTCWLAWCREEPDEPLVLTQFWGWVSSLSRPGRQGPVVRSAVRSARGYTRVQVITRRQTRQDHWDHTLAHANARAINPMQTILFCVARLHNQLKSLASPKNRFHFPLLDK
jgi:hypothetical protein